MGGAPEVETAFEVGPDTPLPDLTGADGVAAVDPPETAELVAVYHDTERLDLARAGITLRRREGGADAGWHLKVAQDAGGDGPRRRVEHHRPLDDQGALDALLEQVPARVRGRPVRPVARVTTTRTTHRARGVDGTVLLEVADDSVRAEALGSGTPAVDAWREWEAELVDGDEDALGAVVALLADVDGAHPRTRSKLGRLLGDRVPEPRALEPRDTSAGEAVRAYLATHVERLLAADAGVRAEDDESVHDARVAMRRLRAALGSFRPVLDRTATDPLRDELRAAARTLGVVRDAAVQRHAVWRLVEDHPDQLLAGPAVRRVDADREAARTAGLRDVHELLGSTGYLRMLDALDDLADAPATGPAAGGRAQDVLPRRARKAWRRLDRRVDALASVAPDERDAALHEVRKAARRARYASEVCLPLVGKPAARSRRRARAVQDTLGAQHDAAVMRDVLRRVADDAHAAGEDTFVLGELHALALVAGEQAEGRADEALSRALASGHRSWTR